MDLSLSDFASVGAPTIKFIAEERESILWPGGSGLLAGCWSASGGYKHSARHASVCAERTLSGKPGREEE